MKNEIVIFSELTTEQKLSEIEEQSKQYDGLVVDMNLPAERKKVKESASLINDMLKTLDRARIDKAKDYKSKVEAEAELIRERLEAANKPLTALIDAHAEEQKKIREAEKLRQDTIQSAFDKMNDSALEAIGQSSPVIEVIIEDIQSYDIDREIFRERTNEAVDKQRELLGKLDQMLKGAIAQEETEAKLAKLAELEANEQRIKEKALRDEQDAAIRAQAERDAEARHAAAIAQAKVDAENAAIKAEADKAKAIEDAKAAHIAEQKRQADIEAEKQRKLEANKKHVGMIRGQAKDSLIKQGLTESQAKDIVLAISNRLIANVTINY